MTSVARTVRPASEPRARAARPARPAIRAVPDHATRTGRPDVRTHQKRSAPGAPRAHRGMALAGLVVVVFGALMASAVVRSMLVTGQEQIDRTNAELRENQQLLQKEKVVLATYQSPARIAARAEALGMVATDDQRWVSLGDGSTTFDTVGSPTDSVNDGTDSMSDGSELAAAPR